MEAFGGFWYVVNRGYCSLVILYSFITRYWKFRSCDMRSRLSSWIRVYSFVFVFVF